MTDNGSCGCFYDPYADQLTQICALHAMPGWSLDILLDAARSRYTTPDNIRRWIAGGNSCR